jgi:hypothetical protein
MPKLPDTNFPDFFANLNNLYDKVFSWNKSSVAPTNNLVPGEVWVDSGNQNRLKIRNDANSAWIDTQLRVDQAFWGLNPSTAQFNASQLRGQSISTTAPTNGQALIYSSTSSSYVPRTPGRVLQVVYAQTSTQVATSSSSLSSIGLSATITPQFANSRILVIACVNGIYRTFSGGSNSIYLAWMKNGVALQQINSGTVDASPNPSCVSAMYMDNLTDNLTSTYGVGFTNPQVFGQVFCQYFGTSTSSITLMEIAA